LVGLLNLQCLIFSTFKQLINLPNKQKNQTNKSHPKNTAATRTRKNPPRNTGKAKTETTKKTTKGNGSGTAGKKGSGENFYIPEEDEIRAPIPPKEMKLRDKVVPFANIRPTSQPSLMESFAEHKGVRQLDQLFKPPRDITFKGTFTMIGERCCNSREKVFTRQYAE
jgi:hypothetical protein